MHATDHCGVARLGEADRVAARVRGADISPRGEGRFRLCGRAASIAGCWRAIEWVRKLREAEAAAGVTDHDDGLYRCQRLLELAEERRQQQQRLQECGATCDGRWSKGWKAAGERAAQLLGRLLPQAAGVLEQPRLRGKMMEIRSRMMETRSTMIPSLRASVCRTAEC